MRWNTMMRAFLGMVLGPSLLLGAGQAGKDSHGGMGAIRENQAYQLDLVEANIERQALNDELMGLRRPRYRPEEYQQVFLVTSEGQVARYVHDLASLGTLDMFVRKSTSRNGYLFGRKDTNACARCYNEEAAFAIFLTNVLNGGELPPEGPVRDVAFSRYHLLANAFNSLNWLVVNAPLEIVRDENSRVDESVKFQAAIRTNNTIRISEPGVFRDFDFRGRRVRHFDFFNRAALILHEIYYFATAQQGDRTSDRARRLNACGLRVRSMKQYLEEYSSTTTDECSTVSLFNIPGVPSNRPTLVSQLPPGSEFEVLRDLRTPRYTSAFVFLRGQQYTQEDYHRQFYPYAAGSLRLYKRHSPFTEWGRVSWDEGETIPRGTILRVTSTYVHAANSEMVTHVSFSPANRSPVMYLEVFTPTRGVPATIPQMEAMMEGYLRWRLP